MQMFYNMIQRYPASIMTRESILISRVSESDNQFHTTNIFFEHIRRSKKSKKKLTIGEFFRLLLLQMLQIHSPREHGDRLDKRDFHEQVLCVQDNDRDEPLAHEKYSPQMRADENQIIVHYIHAQ